MNSWAMASVNLRRCIARRDGTVVLRSRDRSRRSHERGTYVLAVDGFFSRAALGSFGFRWLHILAGITWIGLLYYFNFVQVPAFAAFGDEGRARNIAIDKVARRAL